MSFLTRTVRRLVIALARSVGSKVVNAETGEVIGRAFVIPWRGRIAVIGLDAEVKPVFLPQKRMTYWKQDIGFMLHSPPNFPHEARPQRHPHPPAR